MPFAFVTAAPVLMAAALPAALPATHPVALASATYSLRIEPMPLAGLMPLSGALAIDAAVTAPATTPPAAPDGAPGGVPDSASRAGPDGATHAAADNAPSTVAPPMLDAGAAPAATPVIHDPWEKTNRAIWGFNHTTDRLVLHPAAVVCTTVLPRFVRSHISLGLANLNEPVTTLNDIFQLHMGRAARSLGRFVVNSTLGVAGLFDPATRGGLPAHPADFGQTLGRWGVHAGPYVVLPLFGPSDLRDGFGFTADNLMDPPSYVLGGFTSNFGIARDGAQVIDYRVAAQGTLEAIYEAPDPYSFARSAYIQRRIAVVLDATGQTAALPDFDTPGS